MKKNVELISPLMEGAFSEPILHKVVLSKIDFDLPDDVWNEIDAGFADYWDYEVGVGNEVYFDSAYNSIQKHLNTLGVLYPYENVATILEIMFDFIENIPGALLDDLEDESPEFTIGETNDNDFHPAG